MDLGQGTQFSPCHCGYLTVVLRLYSSTIHIDYKERKKWDLLYLDFFLEEKQKLHTLSYFFHVVHSFIVYWLEMCHMARVAAK